MTPRSLALHAVQADSSHPGRGPGEIFVNQLLVQAHGLEDLRAPVALHRGDAHLGHHFEHALLVGLDEILLGVSGFGPVYLAGLGKFPHRGQGQIRIDGAGAVADEQREMVDLPGVAGLHDQGRLGPGAFPDQVVVDRRHGQQAGYGGPAVVNAAVGQNDDRTAALYGLGHLPPQSVQRLLEGAVPGLPVV